MKVYLKPLEHSDVTEISLSQVNTFPVSCFYLTLFYPKNSWTVVFLKLVLYSPAHSLAQEWCTLYKRKSLFHKNDIFPTQHNWIKSDCKPYWFDWIDLKCIFSILSSRNLSGIKPPKKCSTMHLNNPYMWWLHLFSSLGSFPLLLPGDPASNTHSV